MKDQLKQALIERDAATGAVLTEALPTSGASAREILDEALLPGMEVVGMRMPRRAATIAALKAEGPREQVKVMAGGAPVTAAYAEETGADGYGANAGMAVERAKDLVGA